MYARIFLLKLSKFFYLSPIIWTEFILQTGPINGPGPLCGGMRCGDVVLKAERRGWSVLLRLTAAALQVRWAVIWSRCFKVINGRQKPQSRFVPGALCSQVNGGVQALLFDVSMETARAAPGWQASRLGWMADVTALAPASLLGLVWTIWGEDSEQSDVIWVCVRTQVWAHSAQACEGIRSEGLFQRSQRAAKVWEFAGGLKRRRCAKLCSLYPKPPILSNGRNE